MKRSYLRLLLDGAADELRAVGRLTALKANQAEKMQCVRVTGIGLDNPLVEASGTHQLAGLMQANGHLQKLSRILGGGYTHLAPDIGLGSAFSLAGPGHCDPPM
jgi:hypothetical protein